MNEFVEKIISEKQKTGTVILAHVYQDYGILSAADIKGDSFALARAVSKIDAERVIICGVYFMAEMVKILSPEKKVVIPSPDAGCPMAEMINPLDVIEFKRKNPDYLVAAYVNTTAELKAISDVCVTSSSAVKILSRFSNNNILFIPDKNLGDYISQRLPHKNIVTMEGYCPCHNKVTAEDIIAAKKRYPGAPVAAHPECPPDALALSDMIGATTDIIKFAENTRGDVIISTECAVSDNLNKKYGTNRFKQVAREKLFCEDMKKITAESVYNALTGRGGSEVKVPKDIRIKAKKSIDNMLLYGN